jgi:hypothetical protein
MDLTCPFCIKHHINVHPKTSVLFIKTKKKIIFTRMPPRHMLTKNEFGHYIFGDQILLVSIITTTKKLPNLVSVTTFCWVIKTRTSIPNSHSPMRCVGFVLFNKQWLPYNLEGRVKPLWVLEISNCHIAFAIDVEFSCSHWSGVWPYYYIPIP